MKKRWIFLLLLLLAAGAFFFWRSRKPAADEKGKSGGNQPVAVILGTAARKDVPVWLSGIGTVQASNTVTVRPRVSGALDKVNFTEGSLVKKGDIIAEIDPRPYQSLLAQAEAKKIQDEALLANANLDATRFADLLKSNAVSKQQADQAAANAGQLAALVKADSAAIQAAQLDLDFTFVRAPISGRTGVRLIDAGNLVAANQTTGIVVITELQPISVLFTLPQRDLPSLNTNSKPGEPRPKVEALDDNNLVLDQGELGLIDNQIDPSTGTLRLKATFKNDKLKLWPGQFVNTRILVETKRNAVVIPPQALQPGLDGQFVYLVKQDNTVEARIVKAGIESDLGNVIDEGLEGGERVVTTGQSKLRPGSKVAPQQQGKP